MVCLSFRSGALSLTHPRALLLLARLVGNVVDPVHGLVKLRAGVPALAGIASTGAAWGPPSRWQAGSLSQTPAGGGGGGGGAGVPAAAAAAAAAAADVLGPPDAATAAAAEVLGRWCCWWCI